MKSLRSKISVSLMAFAAFGAAPGLVPHTFAQDASVTAPEKRSTDFTNVLPADDTALVFVMQNFFKYATFDAKTPMARLLAHPAVRQWTDELAPTFTKFSDMGEVIDLADKDLQRLLTGKAVVALLLEHVDPDGKGAATDAKAPSRATAGKVGGKVSVEPVLLIEFKGSAAEYEVLEDKFEARLKKKDPKADIMRERAEGLLIHSYETNSPDLGIGEKPAGKKKKPRKFFRTCTNGTIVIANKKDRLLDLVRALARGATENPLSGRSDFIGVKKEMGENDGFFLINLPPIMQEVNSLLRDILAARVESNPLLKSMMDPESAVTALALQNFTSVYGSLKLDENRLEARYGITWKDRAGVASLINFGKDPVSVPSFVSADYKGLDSTTVDFPATFDAGSALVRAVTPGGYGMIGMMLSKKPAVENALTALRTGFLDNMRPDMITLTGYPGATPGDDEIPGRVMIFSLKDPAAALAAIEAVYALAKNEKGEPLIKPEVKEYLGIKIYSLPEFASPFDTKVKTEDEEGAPSDSQMLHPAYALVGDRFIVSVGSAGLVEGVIANMKNPGKPLVDARFDDSIGTLPGTPCSVSYGDVGTYLKTVMIEVRKSGKYKEAKLTEADLLKARDACKDLHYFWAAKSYYDAQGLYGRLVVTEQADANK